MKESWYSLSISNTTYPLLGRTQPSSLGELIEQDGNTTYALGIFYIVAGIYAARRFLFLWAKKNSTSSASVNYTTHTNLPEYGEDGIRSTVPPLPSASSPSNSPSSLSIFNYHGILQSSRWDTGKLFVGSIFFNCLVRSLSFITLAILAFENVTIDNNDNDNSNGGRTQEQEFYHRVLAILFNVGDWAAISTYLLLVVVWVELLQTTRSHFFRQAKIRRDWMIAYIVLNSILYLVQTGLYLSVLLSPNNPDALLNIIYNVIAFLNIAIPSVWLLTWASYFCQYAGFPFRSRGAKESWQRITRLVTGWTFGRLLWAIAAIFTANNGFEDAVANIGNWLFTVVVVILFVVAELIPLLTSLGTSILQVISRAEEGGIDIDNNNLLDNEDIEENNHSFSEQHDHIVYEPAMIDARDIQNHQYNRINGKDNDLSDHTIVPNFTNTAPKPSIINGRGETVSPILRSSSVQLDVANGSGIISNDNNSENKTPKRVGWIDTIPIEE